MGIDGIAGGVHRHLFPPDEPMQVIALEDVAEFAALTAAAITEATGIPVRYEQLTDAEAAAISPDMAEIRKRWQAGDRWHADVEALRVIHPGLRTLADWLAESGAAAIRARHAVA